MVIPGLKAIGNDSCVHVAKDALSNESSGWATDRHGTGHLSIRITCLSRLGLAKWHVKNVGSSREMDSVYVITKQGRCCTR